MKLKTLFKVPEVIRIAFSGGVDSLVAAHYYKSLGLDVTLWHFNHECEYSLRIMEECKQLAEKLKLSIVIGHYSDYTKNDSSVTSLEDKWRRARYRFLRSNPVPLITAHHLDDAVETWVWSSLHGTPKLIPYKDDIVVRPFLSLKKDKLYDYAEYHNLNWVEDEFNKDLHLMRNYMRANMMEHVFHVNPGIHKVIRKKYLELVK